MALPVPTEEIEHIAVVDYCATINLPCFHVPNSTYTTSIKIKMRNKRLGVSPGVPDLFVVFPGKGIIALEMKRIKGGVVSESQKQWIEILNNADVPTYVCKGAREAIWIIDQTNLQ